MAEKHPGRVPLLATKLFIPRARQRLVSRPHLAERLDGCLSRQLGLVSAPAGFGKTTLVSTWVQGVQVPVAWLSLDEADNDPTRFLRYLVAALQQIDPTIGQDIQGALDASPPPRIHAVIGALVNDLAARPADLVLVLDDFHTIDQAIIHEAIQNLVTHQPPQLHLLIVTREDPPLPLARLRACGQLVELRAHDLRFTPEEASLFLQEAIGLALDARDIHELDARIEGWIAGLQLVALSMQHCQDPAELIAGLSGTHHFILSYLTEEVLRQLSPEVQSFLLETSVLTRLTGPLCDAVTGRSDSGAMLEQLCTSNAFVLPLDEGHGWYRYHHLFSDLLRHQLNSTQPQLVPTLHVRASTWYELQGSSVEAIEHAFAAGDYPRAVSLVERHARQVVLHGYVQTMATWLRRLPQEWRVAVPRANLALGRSLLLRGQLDEIDAYLQNAEASAAERSQAGAHTEASRIRAEADSLRALQVSMRGDTERGCELARQAVEQAPQDDTYIQGIARFALGSTYNFAGRVDLAIESYRKALPLCRAVDDTIAINLIIGNLAVLHMVRGQLRAAAELCRQNIDSAEQSADVRPPTLALVYNNYGAVLYEWGELDAAQQLAEKYLELSRRGDHAGAVVYGNVVLSRIRQAQGDRAGAQRMLDEALPLLRRDLPAWIAPEVVAQQVVLALARGDAAAASQALAQAGLDVDAPISHAREALHIAHLRLLYYLGCQALQSSHLVQALDLAGRLLASAEPAGRMGRVIETLALRALIYQAQGDDRRALDNLGRALALAEPEGYLRLFVNEGAPMACLLEAARERGLQPVYASKLLAAFPGEPDAAPLPHPDLVELLTERELEVLRLMAQDLTYEQVAQRLVVSVNTVRFHVKGLYGKLGVEKRAAAVDKARTLGLL
jgi:LuxR family maltose regulon positive regulatory protein